MCLKRRANLSGFLFLIFIVLIPLFAWNLLHIRPYKNYWDYNYNFGSERILTCDRAIEDYWNKIKDYFIWNLLPTRPYKDCWDDRYNFWNEEILTYDKTIEKYWDKIKDYVNGYEIIQVCSSESGGCYTLKADISNGAVKRVYFSKGKYVHFFADIDKNGNAWDIDKYGNTWDFKINMDSPSIHKAIHKQPRDNGYIIK